MSIHGQPASTDPPVLPERPRLLRGLPVLWHGPDTAQLGVNPRHAILLAGLSPIQTAVLDDLDGRRTAADLLASATTDDEHDDLRRLLDTLCSAAVLDDAAAQSGIGRLTPEITTLALRTGGTGIAAVAERQHCSVIVHGSGRVAVTIATLLASSGVGWVHVHADGVVQPEDTGCGYLDSDVGRQRAVAAQEAVLRVAPEATADPLPRRRLPDLVIVTDTEVAEPGVVADLMSRGVPHLPVRCREGVAVVGPLVLPGRSTCLRCCDLHRAEYEPQWPAIAGQLAGRAQYAEIATGTAAASLAVGQSLLALAQPDLIEHPPACCNATLEIDTMLGGFDRRAWWPHPGCDCGAARWHREQSSGSAEPVDGFVDGRIAPSGQVADQVPDASSLVHHHPRVTGSL